MDDQQKMTDEKSIRNIEDGSITNTQIRQSINPGYITGKRNEKSDDYNSGKNIEVMLMLAILMFAIFTLITLSHELSYTGLVTRHIENPSIPESSINKSNNVSNETGNIAIPVIQQINISTNATVATNNITNKSNNSQSGPNIESGCVTPVDNLLISTNTVLCQGTYPINDNDNNGVIQISSNNIVLDCNGSVINGNDQPNTYGIKDQFSGRVNVTIKNCNINHYDYGINFYNSKNITVQNGNYINNNNNIFLTNTYNNQYGYAKILNNNVSFGASTNIYLEGGSGFNVSKNNVTYGGGFGIDLGHVNNSFVSGNNVLNHTSGGIRVCADQCFNNVVTDNNISQSGWNCVDSEGYYGNYSGNTISQCAHTGFDICGGSHNTIQSAYNNIHDNTVLGARIYICIGINNSIHDNDISNVGWNNVDTSFGITIHGNISETSGNFIYNNTITNVSGDCIQSSASQNTWEGNSLSQCNMSDIRVSNWFSDNSQVNTDEFDDNVYPDGNATYVPDNNGLMNYTVNEQSSKQHIILINTNKYITFNYSGRKEFRVQGNTIFIFNQTKQYPYNDIKNLSSGKVIYSNFDNASITLTDGQQIEIGYYNSSKSPTQIVNIIPNTPRIIISSLSNTTNDSINCSTMISDNDSNILNSTMEWYSNNSLASTVTYTNKLSGSNISSIIDKSLLQAGDVWRCRVKSFDGINYSNWGISQNLTILAMVINQTNASNQSNSTNQTVNHAPVISSLTLLSISNTTADPINCTSTVSDLDNDAINISLTWLANSSIIAYNDYNNSYPTGTIFNASYPNASLIGGTSYTCAVTITDGLNFTYGVSNTLLILAPNISTNSTINITINDTNSSDNNTGNSSINITGNFSDSYYYINITTPSENYSSTYTNISFGWYVFDSSNVNETCYISIDNVSNLTIDTINNSLNQIDENFSPATYPKTYYWQIFCNSTANTTNSSLASFTINQASSPNNNIQSSGGGGGGGALSSDNINESNRNSNSSESNIVVIDANNASNGANSTISQLGTNDNNPNTKPIVEQPKQPGPVMQIVAKNRNFYIITAIIFILASIFLVNSYKNVEVDYRLSNYIKVALYSGYSYEAIRHALKHKGYTDIVIDQHFYQLRLEGLAPIIRFKNPIDKELQFKAEALNSLQMYVIKQRAEGFLDRDIRNTLLHYGHPKSLVEESIRLRPVAS